MDTLRELWPRLQAMGRTAIEALPNLAVALLLLAGFYVGARIVRGMIRRISTRLGRGASVGLLLGRLVQAGIVFIGIMVASTIVFPSFQMGDIVQILGLTSVALGFAFRDVLQNFLAGILILWTRPFTLDDQISYKTFEGTVVDIQTRATFVDTYDGRRIVIPNAELFTNAVTVNTANNARRLEQDFGIGMGDDIDLAKRVALEAVHAVDGVLADPAPDVLVVELGDFAVILRVRWWIEPPRKADLMAARDAVLTRVKQQLAGAGVDLPYPTSQLLFHDQTEDTDGDRTRQREGWPAGSRAGSARGTDAPPTNGSAP